VTVTSQPQVEAKIDRMDLLPYKLTLSAIFVATKHLENIVNVTGKWRPEGDATPNDYLRDLPVRCIFNWLLRYSSFFQP
jgi:hypothetical protein